MATPEERMAALEMTVQQLQGQNAALMTRSAEMQGALQEQRDAAAAAAAARPARHEDQVVDTRVIGRPKSFTGKEEEWPTWSTMVRAYAGAISQRLLFLMDAAETSGGSPNNVTLQTEDDKKLSTQLYFVLAMLLEGKASSKVQLCTRGQGLVLWRMLTDVYEARVLTRSTGLFQQVLGYSFEEDDILSSLELFEKTIRLYESASEKAVGDELKVGILIRNVGQSMV